MLRPSLGVALVLSALTIGQGAGPAVSGAGAATIRLRKPAWQWTLDERLAARFDPAAQAAREAAHRDVIARLHLDGPSDVVDGKESPELYLPTELFNHLLNVAFLDMRHLGQDPRRPIEEKAAALGFTGDLWPRLEAAVSPYLKLRRSTYSLFGGEVALGGKGLFGRQSEQLSVCRLQAEALASAKAEFGEKPFLRLLYEAVAPSTRVSYTLNSISRAEARFIEQGCPAPRAS